MLPVGADPAHPPLPMGPDWLVDRLRNLVSSLQMCPGGSCSAGLESTAVGGVNTPSFCSRFQLHRTEHEQPRQVNISGIRDRHGDGYPPVKLRRSRLPAVVSRLAASRLHAPRHQPIPRGPPPRVSAMPGGSGWAGVRTKAWISPSTSPTPLTQPRWWMSRAISCPARRGVRRTHAKGEAVGLRPLLERRNGEPLGSRGWLSSRVLVSTGLSTETGEKMASSSRAPSERRNRSTRAAIFQPSCG